jgi:asparagine synthase (glutamine-hydrolysing)
MCGIAGYIGSRLIDEKSALRCQDLMKNRGPDDNGIYRNVFRNRHVLLVHTRLAIIDLEKRASQPYVKNNRALCFNGELYNYIEIRNTLKREGIRFETRSDTEVLHQVFSSKGKEALKDCEGMWAFAAYSESDGFLTLCRDRFGEKPLYIHTSPDGVYFASTPKALFALLGKPLKINRSHLSRFLVNGYKFLYKNGHTFFQELEELVPGSLLSVSPDGHIHKEVYWPRGPLAEDDTMSFVDAVGNVKEKLMRSMEIRLRSDVPLAFCMSGGVDSNSLISIAKRIFNYDVHGFTITNSDSRYEEQELVDYSVKELGIKHTSVPLSTDSFLENMRKLVSAHDAPVYTISYYVHWLLMKEISRNGYKISISGTGADELFSGYYDHHLLYLASIAEDENLFTTSRQNWLEHVAPIVRNPYLQTPERFVDDPGFRDHITLGADEFSSRLIKPFNEQFSEKEYQTTLLKKRMLNELFEEAIPVILHEDDSNAMDYSIENRSPFLDRKLFECAMRIPTKFLVKDGMAKAVLRNAMKGIVPDDIVDCRRKVGFNAPVLDLLDTGDDSVKSRILEDSPVYDLIRRESIEDLLQKEHLPNSESKFLFSFIGVKFFMEEYDSYN